MKKKLALTVLSVALVAALAVGGTLAYLTAKTKTVTNTFTVGNNVAIDLTETKKSDGSDNTDNTPWSAAITAGSVYTKNPVVTVTANSEKCWLFVKFEETNNPANYLTYTSTLTTNNGWIEGDGTIIPTNVWYRIVDQNTTDQSWDLLLDNTISVKPEVGSAALPMPSKDAAPSLTYTAYAAQFANLTAPAAWTEVANLS